MNDRSPSGLFIAATREPFGRDLALAEESRASCGGFHICVMSSFPLDVQEYPDLIRIRGFLLPAGTNPAKQSLFSINAAKSRKSLELKRSTSFGLPLYFHITADGGFLAATHIRLLRVAGVEIRENAEVLPEYFLYRCVMPPATFFKGISRMHHGGVLSVSLAGEKASIPRHSPAAFLHGAGPSGAGLPFKENVESIVSHVRGSVNEVNGRAGGTSLLMSGGIDSSMTALLARQALGVDRTYSTAYPFELPELDMEKAYASTAADALGFSHTHYVGTSRRYRQALVLATALAEEPVHHLQSSCMYMLFADGMEPDVRTVIQGLGAGGVFGNFRNHLYFLDKPVYRLLSQRLFRELLGAGSRVFGRGAVLHGKLCDMASDQPPPSVGSSLWKWHLYGDRSWVCKRFGCDFGEIIQRQWQVLQSTEPACVYDIWSRYSLLGDEDVTLSINAKIASGLGLFLHSPLYDQDVLRTALSVPWPEKMHAPENRLRKAMAESIGVPAFIRNRRKTGFGVKRRDWALEGGVFTPFTDLVGKVLDLDEYKATRQPQALMAMTFWCLLTYAIWKRLVIQQEPVERLLSELDEAEVSHLSADPAW